MRTAQAQTESNIQTAIANSYLGNVNQNTPYGNVSYQVTGQGPGGVPIWSQTTTESPNQGQLRELGEQQGIALGNLGLEQTGRVADILGQPYDPRRIDLAGALGGQFDAGQYDPSTLGNFGEDVRARSFALATQGLEDQFGRSEESLRTRLANQGINAGTDAFGAEMEAFTRGKGNAYADALLRADANALAQRGQAAGELGQGFGQAISGRGQNMSEALQQYGLDTQADQAARSNPLNEIIALASGVQTNPITPGMPGRSSVAGTDIAGILQGGYQNQLAQYQQQQANRNALLGALGSLGGAVIASDARLKRDVEYSHADAAGRRWWRFRYLWDDDREPKRLGVMAQEIRASDPHAVIAGPGGWLFVDYGAL